MNTKKVLITGATGFLGSNLCFYLKERNFDVIALGRNENKAKKLIINQIPFFKTDLSKKDDKLNEIIKNVDYVVHCAALSSPWGKYEEFYLSNVVATKNICEACLKNNIKRLIHISSPAIYFEFKDKLNIKEDDAIPKKKANFYADTKYLAENTIDEYIEKGLDVITLRPRAIFGIGDTTLIPRLLKANNERFIPITSKKPIITDITHVDNVCEAIRLSILADKKYSNNKYNVTNDEPIELISCLEKIINTSGYKTNFKKINYKFAHLIAFITEVLYKYIIKNKEAPITTYSIGLLSFSQTLDISKIKKDLNYKPVKNIKEGVEEVLLSIKKEKELKC